MAIPWRDSIQEHCPNCKSSYPKLTSKEEFLTVVEIDRAIPVNENTWFGHIYTCPHCNKPTIWKEFKFCPSCGCPIIFIGNFPKED